MALVIGVTGGIATGKSTVSALIKEQGFTVIDADIAARQVVEPGEVAHQQIIENFGIDLLLENGQINRQKLGSIVFHDEEKRQLLNSIVHPEVRKKMNDEKQAAFERGEQVIFLDIPLLFESKLTAMVEKIIVVYVDEQTQLSRLMNRNGLSKEDALSRIQSQISIEEKVKLGDAIIDNRGSIEDTKHQLLAIFEKWNIQ
ncbi:dephospho-CoA kinase [Caldibacillus lycopersici]|uniref:Dephospho-CoA kinase n=1 Tax=Perspicuibacillus lycopersici TaxID=1325689 RepID=A0AAE3IY45_9BACI|nr:dephospho-CoA kinase [Perspicuibacillus lycopersici]MCU9614175.1 dephospho-CoA kinase [Perspicuibacillus lycopersici]